MDNFKISLYAEDSDLSPERMRKLAVEAAIELIRAEALSGTSERPGLDFHLDNLSAYADRIQEALKVRG